MPDLTYTATIEPLAEGGFMVTVPALPGCFSHGETYEQALEMAKEAIGLHIEGLIKHGKPIPRETEPHTTVAIGVRVPAVA